MNKTLASIALPSHVRLPMESSGESLGQSFASQLLTDDSSGMLAAGRSKSDSFT